MPTNDLAIRFTEEKYATKAEVSKELRISSVDTFWNSILQYRENFFHYTKLKTIEKKTLVFCGCPSINGLLNSIDNKLLKVNRNFSSLFAHPTDLKYFVDSSLSNCLKFVGDKLKLDLDEHFFKSLVRNDVQQIDPSVKPVKNYLEALRFVKNAHVNAIDEDYLAKLYCILLDNNELTSFYRVNEDKNRDNRVLIDRVYTCAPVSLIEEMMESLFKFLEMSNLSAGVKASIAYYYINYVRPFDEFSDELAILIAKSVLGHDGLGELCIYFPLESLLVESTQDLARIFNEVQKNADLTYFVNYFFNILAKNSDQLLDAMANLNAEQIRADFYRLDEPAVQNNPVSEPQKEENVEEIVEETVKEPAGKVSYMQEELAIPYIPIALDEKQASLVEQDLLERDPSLRKGEAHFYARHCTKGKKYTIAQYKKSVGCVYETARTSMDHLAELGYYRKEKIKNKFVYVPISR